MKISPRKKSFRFISTLTIAIIFTHFSTCFAWDGRDLKKNSSIEIESGNLVREGSIIDFFDSDDGNYHSGKVVTMNTVSHGTELVIEDFTSKNQERLFLMNE